MASGIVFYDEKKIGEFGFDGLDDGEQASNLFPYGLLEQPLRNGWLEYL